MKALKIFYLIGLFGIVGAGQARAVDWTLKGFRYGYCGIYDLANISYYGLSNNAVAGMNQSVFYGDGKTYKEGTVTCFNGSVPARAKGLVCTYYQSSVNIPSYSRLIKACTFRVSQGSNGSSCYIHTSLSQFETESAATHTHVVADPYVYRPAECFLSYVYGDTDGRWREQYGYASFTYDNSNGTDSADMSKFITMMVITVNYNNFSYPYTAWSSLLQTAETDTWYYYKYITFNANGGAGTMDNQTIENSGAIAANSFVRGGYEFKGWNTRADGKGTAYDDGSVIRATSADKGPVTLYAQWAGMDVTVSESGYATVFSDKYLIVPANVEVYGFTYSNGNLVQGAVISPGAVLHAGQGYLVKAAAGTYTFTFSTLTATAPESVLTGSTTETDTPAGNIYVWGKPDGDGYEYGFYKYTGAKIGAGRAYYVKQN